MLDSMCAWFRGTDSIGLEENPYASPRSSVRRKLLSLRGPVTQQTLDEYRAIVRSRIRRGSTDPIPGRYPQQRLLLMEEFFLQSSPDSGPIEMVASEGNLLTLLPYVLLGEYADAIRLEAVRLLVPSLDRSVPLHPVITENIADIRLLILREPMEMQDCILADPAAMLLTAPAVLGAQKEEISTRLCFHDSERFEELRKYVNVLKPHARPYHL